MSQPEPPPLNKGQNVPSQLIKWLKQESFFRRQTRAKAIKLIEERDAFGFKKYSQHLMTEDGRNSIEDARQELGDLLQYLFKAHLNGEDNEPVRSLLPVLYRLCHISKL